MVPVTFFVTLPFAHEITFLLAAGLTAAMVGVADGVDAVPTASFVNLIRIVGAEKPKPFILK